MKNFHTNKSILNRGCLVLRNLSLTPAFVKILARTPGCVDMLCEYYTVCFWYVSSDTFRFPNQFEHRHSPLIVFFVCSFIVHCRSMCPKDALVQRSARTIMILVQRVSEKDGNDTETNSFPLTQPRPAPSTQAASSSSFTSTSAQATNTASSIPTTQGLNFWCICLK